MAEEVWKIINGFPKYKISNEGNIWSNKYKKILKVIKGDIKLYDENNLPFTKSVEKMRREHFTDINEKEFWKTIEDYPDYQISNLGNIWSNNTNMILKLYNGRAKIYNVDNKQKDVGAEKLRKQYFEGEFPKGEIFEKIPDWDRYSISKKGKVKDDKEGIFLEPYLSNKGYLSLTLMGKKEKGSCYHLSHLLGLAFIPNPNNLPQIHHIDCNKLNNDLSNLAWVTNMENTQPKNQTRPIGSVFEKKDSWKAEVTTYGKKYQFECIKKELCEEWLERRRFEIKNNLEVESTGFIFPCRKSFKARIRINKEMKYFLHREKNVCEEWLNKQIQENRMLS